MFCNSCTAGASGVVQNFNMPLQDWKTGPITGLISDPVPPDLSQGTTYIFSVNTGVGSGWNNDVLMWVDNIRIVFGASDGFIYNFEGEPQVAPSSVPLLNNYGLILLILSILFLGIHFNHSNRVSNKIRSEI